MRDAKLNDAPAVGADPRPLAAIGDRESLYLASWADRFFAASMIVTLDLSVVWANRAAERLLEKGAPFCLIADRLACTDKAQAGEFRAFVENLGDTLAVWTCPTEGGAHMLVRAEALRPANAEPAAALFFIPAGASPEGYVWADLGEVFGLTPAETAIVKRFIGGERADEMAEGLGVAIETVRTHIRRIYNKLGINSREHLFSLVSPYRIR